MPAIVSNFLCMHRVITGFDSDDGATESAKLHSVLTYSSEIQSRILLHTLPQRYLEAKWSKYVQLAYFGAAVQFVLLSSYVVTTSVCNRSLLGLTCTDTGIQIEPMVYVDESEPPDCGSGSGEDWYVILAGFTLTAALLLLLKEEFQFCISTGIRRAMPDVYLRYNGWYNVCQTSFGEIGRAHV